MEEILTTRSPELEGPEGKTKGTKEGRGLKNRKIFCSEGVCLREEIRIKNKSKIKNGIEKGRWREEKIKGRDYHGDTEARRKG